MQKLVLGNYILAVGEKINGIEISEEEYGKILAATDSKPKKDGFYYKLRDDNKQWDEFKIMPDPETDLTITDTLQALNEMGVDTDD